MIKIKYVGLKVDGERAFMEDTGLQWFPGDVHNVSEENAGKMLRHPDVFAQVNAESVKLADAPKLRGVATDDLDADDEAIAREEALKKAAAGVAAVAAAGATSNAATAATVKAVEEAAAKPAAKKAAAAKPAAKKSAKGKGK